MFKRNEGILDRVLRVALATVLLPVGLLLLGVWQSTVPGLILTGLGSLALITGLTGFCPLYVPFGISTLGAEKRLMARCMSMMANWGPGNRSVGFMCGPGPQSIEKTPDEQG
jgi:hypothetical protein